jgi:hypothetical protein
MVDITIIAGLSICTLVWMNGWVCISAAIIIVTK